MHTYTTRRRLKDKLKRRRMIYSKICTGFNDGPVWNARV